VVTIIGIVTSLPITRPCEYVVVPPEVVDGPPNQSFAPFDPPSVVEKKCDSTNAVAAVVTSFITTKLFFAFEQVPSAAASTADELLPAPALPPIPIRYTGVSDWGHVYAFGAKLKLPLLSVIVDARTIPVDPYPDVPISTTEIVEPVTGCCPPKDRPLIAGDARFAVGVDIDI
jgi:hypothetical protein